MLHRRLLGRCRRYASTTIEATHRVLPTHERVKKARKHFRTFGIVAHIDAGKTTTTERMLYCAGASKYSGNVDTGDTVTDYLPVERERGITINSAAVTFPWRGHCVNLVDTPGHVDFTIEVERSLRAVDAAVIVLDASAGVEAQTMTVWRQARHYHLPAVVFANKIDKQRASYEHCLESLEARLRLPAAAINVPIRSSSDKIIGVVDLVRLRVITWPAADGVNASEMRIHARNMNEIDLSSLQDASTVEQALEWRERLCEVLADVDEDFASAVLNAPSTSDAAVSSALPEAIKRSCHNNQLLPMLCGSALRSVGVQPLLDAIVDYLPSPEEVVRPHEQYYPRNHLCALAFKTEHDTRLGKLTYVRVYSGAVHGSGTIYNVNEATTEHVHKVYVPHSNELEEISTVHAGDLCVVTGMKNTTTGDTLTDNESVARNALEAYNRKDDAVDDQCVELLHGHKHKGGDRLVLEGITRPSRVYYCSIEAPSPSKQLAFDKALEELCMDDPSLLVRVDADSQQTIMEACGELHVEVIKDRLKRQYGLDAFIGPLMITYRETTPLREPLEYTHTMEESIDGNSCRIELTLAVEHEKGAGSVKHMHIRPPSRAGDNPLAHLRQRTKKALEAGIRRQADYGPLLGHPIADVRVELVAFTQQGRPSDAQLSAAAAECFRELMKRAEPVLMGARRKAVRVKNDSAEPVMRVELQLDDRDTGRSELLTELGARGAHILGASMSLTEAGTPDAYTISAIAPLAKLAGIAKKVRKLSHGTAGLHMSLAELRQVGAEESERIRASNLL